MSHLELEFERIDDSMVHDYLNSPKNYLGAATVRPFHLTAVRSMEGQKCSTTLSRMFYLGQMPMNELV